ncbi:16S rRNA (cytosine967-C5)-methyltransferase [Motilibacter rhizosphaerae]|uniref:16S rRNA (Cytosine967-C5)-methyltransferase n=1 Tax=Motilibacter rhizosphaerae TaxID=598652 RepID=A0A4Q7NQZ5_9ACTN|nr:transcription antitermination factor NusB [Motilibacter rhizosphaerae]RZS89385.1 16S rRNA (cytosine967-C5)-methyltransferase [Motilibacter rhizosphaerae]
MSPAAGSAARDVAYAVLRAVSSRDAYANLVLPALLRERDLSTRDAALATELAYGTLRASGTYDAVLATLVDRPLHRIDPPVLDALRLGAHQLLATRIPSHAAVSESVELVRREARSATGFVNAVLRKVGRQDLVAWTEELGRDQDALGRLALRHAHPRWVAAAFADALDGDLGEVERALEADNAAPSVTLVARPGRAVPEELDGTRPTRWSPYARVLESGDPGRLPAVRSGAAGVQDEGSQLVALALAAAPLDGPDARWLDGCAGPGGKAALLAALAGQRGADLLAVERAPHRARLVRQALGDDATVLTADTTTRPYRAGSFDRVLVDVPCSGLGALRRRPEARWRRTPQDVAGLGSLQRELLRAALDGVRPGGVVAYATCSPHLAETRGVVDDVLAERDDADWLDARDALRTATGQDLPELGAGPDVQLWPHRHGTDAMYLALLRKDAAS